MVSLGHAVTDPRVVALFAIGIPIHSYDYTFLKKTNKPTLIVQGEEDEFCAGSEIESIVKEFGPHLTLVRIPGADHYFNGYIDEMRHAITEFFHSGPGECVL